MTFDQNDHELKLPWTSLVVVVFLFAISAAAYVLPWVLPPQAKQRASASSGQRYSVPGQR
jgi:flagellar basal body-associated protein FliL